MPMTHAERLAALDKLVTILCDTIAECGPMGAPSGMLYMALMSRGMTLEQYETLMRLLVEAGKLRRSGHAYFLA